MQNLNICLYFCLKNKLMSFFLYTFLQCCASGSVILCLFDPWIRYPRWVKIKIRIRDEHPVSYRISESLETIVWVKILKLFDADADEDEDADADPDPGSGNLFDPGSGMETIRIRNTVFLSPFNHLIVSLCRYLSNSCTVRMPVSTYRAVEKGTSHTDTYKVSQ
jgi:hypothetical protein